MIVNMKRNFSDLPLPSVEGNRIIKKREIHFPYSHLETAFLWFKWSIIFDIVLTSFLQLLSSSKLTKKRDSHSISNYTGKEAKIYFRLLFFLVLWHSNLFVIYGFEYWLWIFDLCRTPKGNSAHYSRATNRISAQ